MRILAPVKAPLNFMDPKTVVNSPAWLEWFQRISDYYTGVAQFIDPLALNFGRYAPRSPVNGLIAYADGSSWNPGSGQGYYRYDESTATWIFVSAAAIDVQIQQLFYESSGLISIMEQRIKRLEKQVEELSQKSHFEIEKRENQLEKLLILEV